MRFLLKALLAASALIPAATAAYAQDAHERGRWRGGATGAEGKIGARAEARGIEAPAAPRPQVDRSQPRWEGRVATRPQPEVGQRQWAGRGERQWTGRGEQRPAPAPAQANPGEQRERSGSWDRPRLDPGRGDGRRTWTGQAQPPSQVRDDRRGDGADRSNWNRDRRDDGRWDGRNDAGRRRDDRWDGRNDAGRQRENRWDNRNHWNRQRDNSWNDRGGWQANRWNNNGVWNRTWRQDSRYDWNRYRTQNRYAYRLPRYYAPSGWGYGYRRFSIGVVLDSLLWDQGYWIMDPYSYRLPEVYGPYRWVRYYDDAMLVDIRTGRVVDVVYDIFW